jgi:cytochrome c551/c552
MVLNYLIRFFVIFSVLRGSAQNTSQIARVYNGNALFDSNCGSCHNFSQNTIGPELSAILKKRDENSLLTYINNPVKTLIKEGKYDKRKPPLMPSFAHLGQEAISDIIIFIKNNQKTNQKVKDVFDNKIVDPLPPKIENSGLTLKLEYLFDAPSTALNAPIAKINTMVVLRGEKDRTFLSDLRGIIYNFSEKGLSPYFDIRNQTPDFIPVPGLGTGLGSFAFHPDFYTNGLLYTSHTENAGSKVADFTYPDSIKKTLQWVLTEWETKNPNSKTFEGTKRELLRIDMVSQIHGMQEIAFNPFSKPNHEDYGNLYIGIGDGGASENGFPNLCNTPSKLWSSILRIDPLGSNSKNGKYGIPRSNPHYEIKEFAPEVYCRGFRNPNRFLWNDEETMIVADIGHRNIEELNIAQKGGDFGWPYREGLFEIIPKADMNYIYPPKEPNNKIIEPVAQYDHDEGNAISLGFFSEPNTLNGLKDRLIFGDIVTGKVYFVDSENLKSNKKLEIKELNLEIEGKQVSFRQLTKSQKTDLRFGKGANSEMYLYTKTDGKIYKVVGFE